MNLATAVGLCAEMLKLLSKNGGTINDWKYLPIYNEFVKMREEGVKYRCAVSDLSAKYNISKTQIERIIRRFKRDIR